MQITQRDTVGVPKHNGCSCVASSSSSSVSYTSSTVRRLYLLAAALSISPIHLLRYMNEVQSRGGAHHEEKRGTKGSGGSDGARGVQWLLEPLSGVSAQAQKDRSQISLEIHDDTAPAQGIPLVLHAILCVLVLPFTSLGQSSGTPSATVANAAASKESGNKRQAQPRSNFGGGAIPACGSVSLAPKDGNSGRPLFLNMQEHFASLREAVVMKRANSCSQGSRSGSRDSVIRDDSNVSSSSLSTDGDNEADSSASASSPSDSEGKRGRQGVNASSDRGISRRDHWCRHDPRKILSYRHDVDASQLLSELAEPFLGVDMHSVGGSGNPDSKVDLQQSMQLLPRELHTVAGVARLSLLYPPFLPLLLEALLKECVRAGASGLAARHVVVRLIELSAPVLLSPHSQWKSSVCTGIKGENEAGSHAIMLRAMQRFATTVVSLLDVVEDPLWTLSLCSSLVAGQLLQPSAILPIMHRCALALAKMPPLWDPSVALSYCMVTHRGLCAAAHAEEELSARRRVVESQRAHSLFSLDEASPVANDTVVEMSQLPSQSSGEEGHVEKSLSSPAGQSECLFLHRGKRQEEERRQQQWGIPFEGALGRSRSSSSTSPSEIARGGIGSVDAHNPGWRFPEKVPPVTTMSNAIVMTCMILCSETLSQRTVVALGQWCLRSLGVLLATPCAVGLTHLMMKYPQFLEKTSLRSFSLPQNSSSSSSSHSPSFAIDTATIATSTTTTTITNNNNSNGSGGNRNGVYVTTHFCAAVFVEGCRLASTFVRRQVTLRSDGRLALAWQHDGGTDGGGTSSVGGGAAVLHELHAVQCYLVMMLQALVMRRGMQLSTEAQDELVSLFVSISRLRVAVSSKRRERDTCDHTAVDHDDDDDDDDDDDRGDDIAVSNPTRGRPVFVRLIVKLVDESFRAVVRAVDIILHDYDAGCPRRLCEALVDLLPPENSLFSELKRVGAWEKHLDCLETVQAAAEAYREAIRPSSPHPYLSIQVEQENPLPADAPHQKKAFPRSLSLLHLHEELAEKAKSAVGAAATTRSSAEVMFGSLIGVLPSSGEPLRLSADYGAKDNNNNHSHHHHHHHHHGSGPSGGLTTAQQQCWVQHMIVYLVGEWWRNRVLLSAQFPLCGEVGGNKSGGGAGGDDDSALPFSVPAKSFIECCAHPI